MVKLSRSQSNIFISDSTPPRALLADFGFSCVTTTPTEIPEEEGTPSFMAPELLHPTKFGLEKGVPSKETDIYALGMTAYQVLTGQQPFLPERKAGIIRAVILGERPANPENVEIRMSNAVWSLLEECWREDRMARPNILDILRKLCDITGERETADSTGDVAGSQPDIAGSRNSIHSIRPHSHELMRPNGGYFSFQSFRCLQRVPHNSAAIGPSTHRQSADPFPCNFVR